MKIILLLILLGATSFILVGCRHSINYTDGEPVHFTDLPKEVQDTLLWRGTHIINSMEDTVIAELNEIICFNSDYSFLRSTFGP